mgnify:FL=1
MNYKYITIFLNNVKWENLKNIKIRMFPAKKNKKHVKASKNPPGNTSNLPLTHFKLIIPYMALKTKKWLNVVLLVLLLLQLGAWLWLTPHGLDGKLEAASYAVCHQIDSHTLTIGDRLLPLCARCTGIYLGALLGLLYLSRKDRPSGSPSRPKLLILAALFLVFVMDGVNSMLTTFLHVAPLYTPLNTLRLATGLLMGMLLAQLLLPLWNQTLWKETNPAPVFSKWRQLAFLLLIETVAGLLVWLDIPLLYYPIAILSVGTIFVILSMVYSLLWCIILNKENSLTKTRDGINLYLLGAICAFVQIGLMDLLRYNLTGSWSGFQL